MNDVDTATGNAAPFAYDGPAELLQPIVRALSSVVDPELALSIVDVGLVYSVKIEDNKAHVRITMTSAACPVTEVIIEDVEHALDKVLPAHLVIAVELTWEPEWTPARMSERARKFMQS